MARCFRGRRSSSRRHGWLSGCIRAAELPSDPWWSAAGVYYAGFPAIALIAIRQDPEYGFHAILYLFLVVWSADTGAFFVGRLIGGPKLAPKISPNKTWSGFIGGALSACLAGVLFAVWFGHTSIPAVAALSIVLAVIRRAAISANRSSSAFRSEGFERAHSRAWRRAGPPGRACFCGDRSGPYRGRGGPPKTGARAVGLVSTGNRLE